LLTEKIRRPGIWNRFGRLQSKITDTAYLIFEAWRERDHDDIVLAVGMACWAASNGRLDPEP
jgi:hypothetical protein